MGHYHAVAVKFVIKKDAPPGVIQFFQELINPQCDVNVLHHNNEALKALYLQPIMLGKFVGYTRSTSASHPAYNQRGIRETEAGWEFRAYWSSKWSDEDELLDIAKMFESWLVLDDGLIVIRSVYDLFPDEDVIYYRAGHGFDIAKGHVYENDNNFVIDDDHPTLCEITPTSAFDPEYPQLPDHLQDIQNKG